MLCYVMSCHVMSCHVMSCHVMSCHVMSCHVMLRNIMNAYIVMYKYTCCIHNARHCTHSKKQNTYKCTHTHIHNNLYRNILTSCTAFTASLHTALRSPPCLSPSAAAMPSSVCTDRMRVCMSLLDGTAAAVAAV